MGRTCRVSFTDGSGTKHTAEVVAETLYEAALVGLKAISETWAGEPGMRTPISISTVPVEHQVTLFQIKEWAEKPGGRSPKEVVMKNRLTELLPK